MELDESTSTDSLARHVLAGFQRASAATLLSAAARLSQAPASSSAQSDLMSELSVATNPAKHISWQRAPESTSSVQSLPRSVYTIMDDEGERDETDSPASLTLVQTDYAVCEPGIDARWLAGVGFSSTASGEANVIRNAFDFMPCFALVLLYY